MQTKTGGAAVVTEQGEIARARVSPCLSSTHAELVAAALGACFAVHRHTTTHIDATSAISSITGQAGPVGKHRDIVRAIHWLSADRHHRYAHVKAHTSNTDLPSQLNRAADLAAKAAAHGRPSITPPDFTHFLDPFIFRVAGSVCQTGLYSTTLRHLASSRTIPPSSHSGSMFTRTDTWRDPSFFSLRSGNFATHTFAWKLLTRTLPTLESLHNRQPDIYASNSCPTCPDSVESIAHIFLHCPAHLLHRALILTQLETLLRHHDPDGNATSWLPDPNDPDTTRWEPEPIAAALIPTSLQLQLSHLNPLHATSVARSANQLLVNAYKAIWASRCTTIRQHGLTWGQLTESNADHS